MLKKSLLLLCSLALACFATMTSAAPAATDPVMSAYVAVSHTEAIATTGQPVSIVQTATVASPLGLVETPTTSDTRMPMCETATTTADRVTRAADPARSYGDPAN